ncbi:MAG: F0F1 ATP synthase subunit B [Clostridia bacterium]|jgi:F-type H+-transporting ATPase subunit b|nr:F0F1 ATP synthase subunit B [Clostridia bacterium]
MLSFDAGLLQGIAIQMLNTAILFIVMSKLLFKPVSNFMENRKAEIVKDIKTARDKERNAEELEKKYNEKLKNIDKEKETILTEARKTALDMKDKIIGEAKVEASKIIDRANAEVEKYKSNAQDTIKKEMIGVASEISKKVIDIELDEDKHIEVIDTAIEEFGDMEWIG